VLFLALGGGLSALRLDAQPMQSSVNIAGTLPEDYLPGLKGIIETALKQSPTMLLQNLALVQQEANRYRASSILWPALNSTFSYAFNGARTEASTSSTSTSSGGYYGFTFSQPVFQWGSYMAQADIAKLGQQVAQRQYADIFRGLASTLRSQYLGLVMAKISLGQNRYQLSYQEKNLAVQKEMVAEGTVSPGDLVALQLATDEARLAARRAEMEYDYGKTIFRRLAGLEELPDEFIPDDLPRPADTVPAADALLAEYRRNNGPENSLQGQISALNIKREDLNYKIAKTGVLYPKFSFTAGYGLSYSQVPTAGVVEQSAVRSYNYGISANMPLFDGFSTRGAKMSALASKRTAERQMQTLTETSLDSAQISRSRLGVAAETLRLAEVRRSLADDALKRGREEFQEGTVAQNTLDALTLVFNGTDYAAVNARVAYLNLWSDFVSSMGVDPVLRLLPSGYLTLNHGK
jgi:outer membrane protein TolC